MASVTLRGLLEAGAHFGHQTNRWNPKMKPYIFGARNGVYIIDLQKTLRLFKEALEFLKGVGANGGEVLFVGTKPQAQEIVAEEARDAGMPYVTIRWLGGTLTNFSTIKNSIARLVELDGMKEDGTFVLLAKKEAVRREKNRLQLDKFLGGIKNMGGIPKAMFIVDAGHEHIAIREAVKLKIPVVAMVDTNADPTGVDYILPGNDDALRSIRLFVSLAAQAVSEGVALRQDSKAGAQIEGGDKVAQEILAAASKDEEAPAPQTEKAAVAAPAAEPPKAKSAGEKTAS
ncbi:MAG TPA: 30S ribosomal protein S2 [Nitrospinae bacterium]|nr:30S ribosomal protein S2 [Nitrospinota bacterium]